MTGADVLNRRAWGKRRTAARFARRTGFASAGEAHTIARLSELVGGQPILDIGVGGGRTTELLRAVSEDYLGVDYLDGLVATARRRFPGARFATMDARDLGELATGAFAAVVFSLNGLDGMTHADRARTLTAVHRVLRPGGWFYYSTLNLAWTGGRWRPDPRRTVRHPWRAVRFVAAAGLTRWHRWRLRELPEAGDGWRTVISRAYGRPVTWHKISADAIVREVRAAGFGGELELRASDGRVLPASGPPGARDAPDSPELHVLAQRL